MNFENKVTGDLKLKLNTYTGEGKGLFFKDIYLGSHGKQHGGCKDERTQRRVNDTSNQLLGR